MSSYIPSLSLLVKRCPREINYSFKIPQSSAASSIARAGNEGVWPEYYKCKMNNRKKDTVSTKVSAAVIPEIRGEAKTSRCVFMPDCDNFAMSKYVL